MFVLLSVPCSGNLPKERAANREKNQPLCMAQYYRLLGSCRRPGDPRDSQYLPEPRADQHVIVTCRNQVTFALGVEHLPVNISRFFRFHRFFSITT